MGDLALRAYTVDDVALFVEVTSEFEDFSLRSPLREPPRAGWDSEGALIVTEGGDVVGDVNWYHFAWGPFVHNNAFGIGITVLPAARGRGIGTWAQRELARLIFAHTPVNRVEASTDVTNLAEQRSLEKAGFTREGVMRGAQWRLGAWHDMVQFSRLRNDPPAGVPGQLSNL